VLIVLPVPAGCEVCGAAPREDKKTNEEKNRPALLLVAYSIESFDESS